MIHSWDMSVPARHRTKTKTRALTIAGRDIANPVDRLVRDLLFAAIALLPVRSGLERRFFGHCG